MESLEQIAQLARQADFLNAIGRRKDERCVSIGFDRLSDGEKLLFRIQSLFLEISYNGLSGYFWNSAGDEAIELLADLKKIGAHHTAKTLERTFQVFPSGMPPKDRSERCELLSEIGDEVDRVFDEVEDEFHRENLEKLIADYFRSNFDCLKD